MLLSSSDNIQVWLVPLYIYIPVDYTYQIYIVAYPRSSSLPENRVLDVLHGAEVIYDKIIRRFSVTHTSAPDQGWIKAIDTIFTRKSSSVSTHDVLVHLSPHACCTLSLSGPAEVQGVLNKKFIFVISRFRYNLGRFIHRLSCLRSWYIDSSISAFNSILASGMHLRWVFFNNKVVVKTLPSSSNSL